MNSPVRPRPAVARPLLWFALAVIFGHHVGTIFKPLGTVGPTEWADWIDLVVVFLVMGAAAAVLSAAGADRRAWLVFGLGAVLYVQGHGLHLSANSVGNAEPVGRAEDAAHLWDEVVSHYVWYVGLAVVVASLVLALRDSGWQLRWPGSVPAALFGFTWATNSIEGGTPVLGLAVAVAYVVVGWRARDRGHGRALLVAYGLSLALLVTWGVWHQGFPQFSELGWI